MSTDGASRGSPFTIYNSSFSIPFLLILLLAFLTRIWRLDDHSVWLDEAISLKWASSAPSETWRVAFALVEEKHPPLYYLALHYWRDGLRLLGLENNDAALRLSGALLGVLTVWGLMLLAGRVSGRRVSLLAGLLLAVSPVFVWYSQELRMFQPAATGAVWAAFFLTAAWQGRSGWARLGWWVAMVMALLAALYSYLFSAFILPAVGLTLIALLVRARAGHEPLTWLRFGEGLVALMVTTALFLPLAANAWGVNSSEGQPGSAFMNFLPTLARELRIFTIWRVDWPAWLTTAAVISFAALTLIGLIGRHEAPETAPLDARLCLLLWIGAPLLTGGLLLAVSDTVFAEDRYLLFIGPFVLWAVARGALAAGAIINRTYGVWLMGGATVLILFAALSHLWTPAMQRENWRAAVNYVTDYQRASPGLSGAAVAHADYTRYAIDHYLRPEEGGGVAIFHPFAGSLGPEDVETLIEPALQGIASDGATTLWLFQSHLDGVDDQYLVEGWLQQNYPLITEQYPAGVKLTGHALQSFFPALPELTPGAASPAAELAPGLTLAACELVTPQVQAADDQMHPPSGWVHVRLWWRRTGEISDDYLATVQMVGSEGVWGDRLYRDNEALRRWPTSVWSSADFVRDEIDVNLNPLTPDGEYPIIVGLLNSAGQPVGEKAECGRVRIEKGKL
jgi:uncharacterized membrane protein